MSVTKTDVGGLVSLRDEVADLRIELKSTNKRLSQVEVTVLEAERAQRIIIGKLEEVLQHLRDVFPHVRKK